MISYNQAQLLVSQQENSQRKEQHKSHATNSFHFVLHTFEVVPIHHKIHIDNNLPKYWVNNHSQAEQNQPNPPQNQSHNTFMSGYKQPLKIWICLTFLSGTM